MEFYNEKEQLYLITDVFGVGLRASILHMRNEMQLPRNEAPENAPPQAIAFVSKSLTRTETQYSNIIREALGIPYEKNFHHYCLQTTDC